MGLLASNTVRLLIGLIITISLVAFFSPSAVSSVSSVPIPFTMAAALRGLDVTLEQTNKAPPSIKVSVRNNNDGPVTILTYGSPLDPLSPQLGMLYITPLDSDEPLEIQKIEVQRQWPPTEDALVEIPGGEKEEYEITLQEPVIPMDQVFEKATIQLKGTWQAVWPTEKGAVDRKALQAGGTGEDALTGDFKSNVIDIHLDE